MRRLIITNNAFDFLDFHVETFDTVLSGLYEKVNSRRRDKTMQRKKFNIFFATAIFANKDKVSSEVRLSCLFKIRQLVSRK